jgi:hypothetical protein
MQEPEIPNLFLIFVLFIAQPIVQQQMWQQKAPRNPSPSAVLTAEAYMNAHPSPGHRHTTQQLSMSLQHPQHGSSH